MKLSIPGPSCNEMNKTKVMLTKHLLACKGLHKYKYEHLASGGIPKFPMESWVCPSHLNSTMGLPCRKLGYDVSAGSWGPATVYMGPPAPDY